MAGHDGYTRYTVRIPTPLYERIKAASGEKSVNAEIIERLNASFGGPSLGSILNADNADDEERERQLIIEVLSRILSKHSQKD